MERRFVEGFLLPLVKGGTLEVGRPLGFRALESLRTIWARGVTTADVPESEMAAALELQRRRHGRARAILPGAAPPALDEPALRLGIAVHNLLALGHPDWTDRALERAQGRVAELTLPIADLGTPVTATQVVARHTLLVRLPEITRTEHTVRFWAGERQFIGRPPPPRLLAMPRLRGVKAGALRRLWFKEIGVPSFAEPIWVAIQKASPLGEALDPLRLSPPLSWHRVLPVLRFPSLCRYVADRVLDLGLDTAGVALVTALLRFAAERDPRGALAAPDEVAFAIRFVAHLCWLQHLFAPDQAPATLGDLSVLMVAAFDVDARLCWPSDVSRESDVGRAFSTRLSSCRREVVARVPDRYRGAVAVCRLAASATAPLL